MLHRAIMIEIDHNSVNSTTVPNICTSINIPVNVGPWVFRFSRGQQDIGHYFEDSAHNFKQIVVRQMFQREFTLRGVTWIWC